MFRPDGEETASRGKVQTKRPLGSTTKFKQSREDKKVCHDVLGGDEDFTKSLTTTKQKPKKQERRRKAAELNAESRRSVWEDSDDEEDTGQIKKFTKLTDTPKWAKIGRQVSGDDDSDIEEDPSRSTGTFMVKSQSLAPTYIQMEKCVNGNSDSPNTGKLTSVRFHKQLQVLMTASTDKSVRLFQVDGKKNSLLKRVLLDNYPVMSAEFNPCNNEIVTGSKHRGYYCYDMMADKVIFMPKIKALEETNMSRLRVSPDGRFIVFLGSFGNIHLISAKSKEWIHSLHMNGGVTDLTFSHDGNMMYGTGDEGRIYVFDLSARRCVHHFIDDGCIQGTSIAYSDQYLACGSSMGVVNLYDKDACMMSRMPKPVKAISNLVKACTLARFNHNTEILALASNFTESAVKLVHLPSMMVFSNFPEADKKIRIPYTMDFSPHGGYFAIGNQKGKALLYRVKHYGAY